MADTERPEIDFVAGRGDGVDARTPNVSHGTPLTHHGLEPDVLTVAVWAAGLVGLVVMLCSRHRQRVGDHVAGTLLVRD